MNTRTPRTRRSRTIHQRGHRRGNTLVFVAGVLVLLVIIATAYITRTGTERTIATAQRTTAGLEEQHRVLGDRLAREITEHLFVRRTLPLPLADRLNANTPRLPLEPGARRYGIDPELPINHAPYHVVPWTNWPDAWNIIDANRGDIVGNPGTGDTRWLRSTEPSRFLVGPGPDGVPFTPDDIEVFTHWPHMSYIGHATNGFRIVRDISDVLGNGLLTNLNQPVEQFLPEVIPAGFNPTTGKFEITDGQAFVNLWQNWFDNQDDSVLNGNFPPPPNRIELSDISGNFNLNEVGERPTDAFRRGALRWHIERILTDTTGDGYTDSFWWLVPTKLEGGIRQIMSVSVIDAGGLLNVNTSTAFNRGAPADNAASKHGTRGHTPADVALMEFRLNAGSLPLAGVGFLNNPENWETSFPSGQPTSYAPSGPWGGVQVLFPLQQWSGNIDNGTVTLEQTYLWELTGANTLTPQRLAQPEYRLDYWRRMRLQLLGLTTDPLPLFPIYPFGVENELQLRMFEGQNIPWAMSRFEQSVQGGITGWQFVGNSAFPNSGISLFRDNVSREETSPFMDRLTIRPIAGFPFDESLHDLRRRVTMYNGARNETMPPWLWWEHRHLLGAIGAGNEDARARFLFQSRLKLDLREVAPAFLSLDPGEYSLAQRLPWMLLTALSDGAQDANGNPVVNPSSYYLNVPNIQEPVLPVGLNDYEATGRLAAAFTANILAQRILNPVTDPVLTYSPVLSNEVVPIPVIPETQPESGSLGDVHPNRQYMAIKGQPFLVEAFIAHIHEVFEVPNGYFNSGQRFIYRDYNQETLVAVQIANPFDRPIDINGFGIRVFDQLYTINNEPLLDPHQPRTFWLIPSDEDNYRNALDIQNGDRASADVSTAVPSADWSAQRTTYDTADEFRAVELVRNFGGTLVVLDRIDRFTDNDSWQSYEFGERVVELETAAPTEDFPDPVPPPFGGGPPNPPPGNPNPPPLIFPPGTPVADPGTHWIQYARVSRAWDLDLNGNGVIDANERNPRFVFSYYDVDHELNGRVFDKGMDPNEWFVFDGDKPTRFSPLAPGTINTDPNMFWDKNVLNDPDHGAVMPYLGFPMQMSFKGTDYDQLGEIANVWLYGHLLRFTGGALDVSGEHLGTLKTFAEHMADTHLAGTGTGERVNRLVLMPDNISLGFASERGRVVGIADPNDPTDPRHAFPRLPAGVRAMDLFVLDSVGANVVPPPPPLLSYLGFGNAMSFSGALTPGLININTATREVLRALPHMYRLVHETGRAHDGTVFGAGMETARRTRAVEGMLMYRDLLGNPDTTSTDARPTYATRGWDAPIPGLVDPFIPAARSEPGFVSIGEPALAAQTARLLSGGAADDLWNDSWSIEFAGGNPFRDLANPDVPINTDLSTGSNATYPDANGNLVSLVEADAEKLNTLYSGISNLISTRSDVFIVYFKVRSFRQNPETGVWDATDPDRIVDESRYVMMVDRSNVNSPEDQPRILFLEKLPF